MFGIVGGTGKIGAVCSFFAVDGSLDAMAGMTMALFFACPPFASLPWADEQCHWICPSPVSGLPYYSIWDHCPRAVFGYLDIFLMT